MLDPFYDVAVLLFLAGCWGLFHKIRRHSSSAKTQPSFSISDRPRVSRNTVILPVPAKPSRAGLGAVEYAKSISMNVIAVHVRTGGQERE